MIHIHPTAIVDPGASLEEGVVVDPFTIIGDKVTIGHGTWIGSHVVIEGETEIGEGCQIFHHAVLGVKSQDLKYRGEETYVKIGDGTVIREFATVHRGTVGGGGVTVVGNRNYIMAYAHVAHDCLLGDDVVMASLSALAGHVLIEEHAIIGGLVGIHQFVRIGRYALIGACSAVLQDIPPYVKVQGNRAKPYGLNTLGLRRHGFDVSVIQRLKQAYRIVFLSGLNTTQALAKIEEDLPSCPEVDHLIKFIRGSERGIAR